MSEEKTITMYATKQDFIDAIRVETMQIEKYHRGLKEEGAIRLSRELAKAGIHNEIVDGVHVVIADEYQITDGTNRYSRSCFWLSKGGRSEEVSARINDSNFVARIGEAMVSLDKPVVEKEPKEYLYHLSGNSLSEIIEQAIREMIAEQVS